MKSIIQKDMESCYLCGRQYGLETHHVLGGTANRRLSERYGLTVKLCHECHAGGRESAQYEAQLNKLLKQDAQVAFEEKYSHDDWMRIFRKNYL